MAAPHTMTGREIIGGAVAEILPTEKICPHDSNKIKCRIYLRAVANADKTRIDVLPNGPYPTDILEVAKCSAYIHSDLTEEMAPGAGIAQWSFSVDDWRPFNLSRLETTLSWKLPLRRGKDDDEDGVIGKRISLRDSEGIIVGCGIIEQN